VDLLVVMEAVAVLLGVLVEMAAGVVVVEEGEEEEEEEAVVKCNVRSGSNE